MYNIFIVHCIPGIWILKGGKREHWNRLPTTNIYQKIMQKFALIQPFYRVLRIQGIIHFVGGSWKLIRCKQGYEGWMSSMCLSSSGSTWSPISFFDIFKICFFPLVWSSSHGHQWFPSHGNINKGENSSSSPSPTKKNYQLTVSWQLTNRSPTGYQWLANNLEYSKHK